jgi:hypothetical protein
MHGGVSGNRQIVIFNRHEIGKVTSFLCKERVFPLGIFFPCHRVSNRFICCGRPVVHFMCCGEMLWGQAAGILLDSMREYAENIRKDMLLHVLHAWATVHKRHIWHTHKKRTNGHGPGLHDFFGSYMGPTDMITNKGSFGSLCLMYHRWRGTGFRLYSQR